MSVLHFTIRVGELILNATRMSHDDDERFDDAEIALATRTKPKAKRPSLYKVILLNDDYTPMDFVILILEKYFNYGIDGATDIMMQVHEKGLAVVGIFPFEIAETKVQQVMTLARQKQHPLQCIMEKE